MPAKPKLYKNSKNAANRPSCSHQIENQVTSVMTPEFQQKFELELCWCIQQIQVALKSGKLNNKQAQDHTKALNTLMSNTTSIVKKRQVMRLSFGDYREKNGNRRQKKDKKILGLSVAEDGTESGAKPTVGRRIRSRRWSPSVGVVVFKDLLVEVCTLRINVKPAVPCKKSVFIKKSVFTESDGNKFKFNFPLIKDDINNGLLSVKIEDEHPNDTINKNNYTSGTTKK
ncbi:hypothetical protein NQ317_004035 [Molorchus minor]|uniref:Uncharacterized protein n=1 Tax=Molorchus minor TaxID=1323400 RepID=A0ABQ9JTT1_9CUCU|nr:hypothetical protein NQ317_004035 [Molorchus minor]